MIETLAWSTSSLVAEILCSKTIPSITMKWHFPNLELNSCLSTSEVQSLNFSGNAQN